MKYHLLYLLLILTNHLVQTAFFKNFKTTENDISQQLSDIFNMSFSTGQFPSVLKIAKVIPIHKKQSRVDYTNYRPISLLSNIEKINL